MIRFACPNCQERYELHPALALLPLVCKQCGNRITPPAVSTLPESPPVPAPKPAIPAPPAKPVAPPPPPAEKKPVLPVAQLLAKPQPASPPPSASTHTPPPATLKPASAALNDTNDDDDVFVTKPDSTPDIDFNVGGPTAASLSDAARARPAGLSDAARARPAGLSDANRPRPADLQTAESVGSAAKTDPVYMESINLSLLGPEPTKAGKKPAPIPQQPQSQAPATNEKPEPTLVPFVVDLVVFVVLVVCGILLGEFLAKKPTGQVLSEAGSAVKFPPVDLIMWGGPPVMFALLYILLGSREKSVGAWLRRRKARQNSQ